MNLATLRTNVTYQARNAKDISEYDYTQIDTFIQQAADIFIRATKATRRLDPITLTANSATLPAFPSGGFLPEFLLDSYLTSASGALCIPRMSVIPYEQILDKQFTACISQPRWIGFSSTTAGIVYPTPDATYTLNWWWYAAFTSWTPGATASTVTSFNVVDEGLRIIATGAAALMQLGEPANASTAQIRLQQFTKDTKEFASRAASSRAPGVMYRDNPRPNDGHRLYSPTNSFEGLD